MSDIQPCCTNTHGMPVPCEHPRVGDIKADIVSDIKAEPRLADDLDAVLLHWVNRPDGISWEAGKAIEEVARRMLKVLADALTAAEAERDAAYASLPIARALRRGDDAEAEALMDLLADLLRQALRLDMTKPPLDHAEAHKALAAHDARRQPK